MSRPDNFEMIAAYLDGTLDKDHQYAFEKSLAADPVLKAEVEFQKHLDASMYRLFMHEAPAAQASDQAANQPASQALKIPTSTPAQHSRWRLAAWISAAAALLLVSVGAWFVLRPDPHQLTPQAVYALMEKDNFVPNWKCVDDAQFVSSVQTRLGEGLLIPAATPGLQVVGWAYAAGYQNYILSKGTMVLITKKDDDNILLFIDRLTADRKLSIPKSSGLHIFRDTLGSLVLYEVTPRTAPVVIPVAKANKAKCPGATNGLP